jgi:DNA-binding SARP family transcriptional activator
MARQLQLHPPSPPAPRAALAARRTLHLIGGPYVTIDGHAREVPQGSKRLLVFVALHQRRVERRHVAGALWPIGDDDRACGNLRSALWRLRGAGVDLLIGDKWSLWLDTDVRVDAQELADWAHRLIDGTAVEDDLVVPPGTADALDLLPGWYDDWATVERERLRQRMLHALEALSGRLVSVRRCAEAVETAMLTVRAEPLRESAQRALIEAHLAEGNWVEGLRSYQLYRRRLRRELGVEPSDELPLLLRSRVKRGAVLPLPTADARAGEERAATLAASA